MPECYADTLMLETFVPTSIGYNHQRSCFKVESQMVTRNNKPGKLFDQFAVGIVDNDEQEIVYLNECSLVIDRVEGSLYLRKNPSKHHYIILISPDLEKWVINLCEEEGISLKDFNLPESNKELKRITQRMTSEDNPDLKKLFKTLSNTNNLKVKKLIHWVDTLKKKNYHVNQDELVCN